jgi:hypothetical protein
LSTVRLKLSQFHAELILETTLLTYAIIIKFSHRQMENSMLEPFLRLKHQVHDYLTKEDWQPNAGRQPGILNTNLYEPNPVCLPNNYDDDEPLVVDQPMNLHADTEPLPLGPYPSDLQVCPRPPISYQHVHPQMPNRNVSEREYSLESLNLQMPHRNVSKREYSLSSVTPLIPNSSAPEREYSRNSVGTDYSSNQYSVNEHYAASSLSALHRTTDMEYATIQPNSMSLQHTLIQPTSLQPISHQTMALQMPSHSMSMQSGAVDQRSASIHLSSMLPTPVQPLMQPLSSSRGHPGFLQQTSALASDYNVVGGLEWREISNFNLEPSTGSLQSEFGWTIGT